MAQAVQVVSRNLGWRIILQGSGGERGDAGGDGGGGGGVISQWRRRRWLWRRLQWVLLVNVGTQAEAAETKAELAELEGCPAQSKPWLGEGSLAKGARCPARPYC